jgi:L-asparaginase II
MPLRLPTGEALVDVERSGVVESVHRGHVVVLGPDGSVRRAIGAVTVPVFPRSSAKPLQAVGMLRQGLDLTGAELALAAASHDGQAFHVNAVRDVLTTAGLAEADLSCPADLPGDEAARAAVLAAGGHAERIYMNCSGKHAAMLRTCVARDWPLSGYLAPGHPLQRTLADAVAELSAEPIADTGVDGCGAPLFAISLTALARAFARIAGATDGPERRLADAMRANPEYVGGTTQTTSRLMAGVPGLVAKAGAEGVFAAALADGGAVALKIDDGAQRAGDRVMVGALRTLGVGAAVLDDLATAAVLGGGEVVGAVRLRDGVL